MGQKISVNLLRAKQRLANVHNNSSEVSNLQSSVWFATSRNYSKYLLEDKKIRDFIKKTIPNAGLVKIIIRRYFKKLEITLFVTKPGLVIGKGGATINKLKEDLVKKIGLADDLKLDIQEFKDPYKSAQIIADELCTGIQRGIAYRRLAKTYLEKIRYAGILGAKITLAGRLNGAEIARTENFSHGSVPRHTIDANIDYAQVHCKTKAGIVGIKVWLYKGDKFKNFTY